MPEEVRRRELVALFESHGALAEPALLAELAGAPDGAVRAQAVLNGLWLLPAVLVGLIVRRPGAAFFGGFVAAAVSVLLGSIYGADALISGLFQGAGAEIGFALGLYRRWTLPFAMISGGLAGLAATIHDVPIYYLDAGADVWLVYGIASVASGALVAGLGAWLLVRALVRTGVLREFAVGREQRPV